MPRRFGGLPALAEIWGTNFSDPFFQLRRRFMAGRLLEGLGRYAEADSMFREVIALDLEPALDKGTLPRLDLPLRFLHSEERFRQRHRSFATMPFANLTY